MKRKKKNLITRLSSVGQLISSNQAEYWSSARRLNKYMLQPESRSSRTILTDYQECNATLIRKPFALSSRSQLTFQTLSESKLNIIFRTQRAKLTSNGIGTKAVHENAQLQPLTFTVVHNLVLSDPSNKS